MEITQGNKLSSKTILLFFFSLFFFKSFAQKNIDSVAIFKMWLYIDMESIDDSKPNINVFKSDSLYSVFSSIIDIKINKMDVKGFKKNYSFYSLEHFDKNNKYVQNIFYKRPLSHFEKDIFFIGQNNQGARQYIIVINNDNGRSYRLAGFNNSDFLNFLNDFKTDYNRNTTNKRMTVKSFLKNYRLDSIDFECLYKGLIEGGDIKKYPCLKSCYEPTVTY